MKHQNQGKQVEQHLILIFSEILSSRPSAKLFLLLRFFWLEVESLLAEVLPFWNSSNPESQVPRCFKLKFLSLIVLYSPAVDCNAGEWGTWSACSTTCGGGSKNRTRLVAKELLRYSLVYILYNAPWSWPISDLCIVGNMDPLISGGFLWCFLVQWWSSGGQGGRG